MIADVWNLIFLMLDFKNFGIISNVNKTWCQLVSDPLFLKQAVHTKFAFKAEDWNKYCGAETISIQEIEKSFNLLDRNIFEFLKQSSSAFPGKRIMDAHTLVWIPQNLNGKIATINTFIATLHLNINAFESIIEQEGSKPFTSGWVLISNHVLPGSRNKPFVDQKKLTQDLSPYNEMHWRAAKLAELIVCTSAHYLKTRKLLFDSEPTEMTYIRCEETSLDSHLATRSLDSLNHIISPYKKDYDFIGVASLFQF